LQRHKTNTGFNDDQAYLSCQLENQMMFTNQIRPLLCISILATNCLLCTDTLARPFETVVTGHKAPEGPNNPDSFGCKKVPERCLPTNPPPIPQGNSDHDPSGAGRDVPEHSERIASLIRSMNCDQLAALKNEYMQNVANESSLRERWNDTVKQTSSQISDAYYSDATLDDIETTTNAYCGFYEIEVSSREEQATCTNHGPNKPQRCSVPAPSAHELLMLQRCTDGKNDLATRRRGLDNLKAQRTDAERAVASLDKQIETDTAVLKTIAQQMHIKKCK
jgi:hypothetical protein